jgi:hypothetical protein
VATDQPHHAEIGAGCQKRMLGRGSTSSLDATDAWTSTRGDDASGKVQSSHHRRNKSRLVFEAPSVSEAHFSSSLSVSEVSSRRLVIPLMRPGGTEQPTSYGLNGIPSQRRFAPKGCQPTT